MVNYMVAMDTGESAKVALFAALDLMKPQDHLYVACIVQETRTVSSYKYPSYMPNSIASKMELDNLRRKAKDLLDIVARVCEQRRVQYSTMVAVASHVGEMLCQIVEKLRIDIMLIGRRSGVSMGSVRRMILGSNSKYCVENAKCTVIVKKESKLADAYQREWDAALRAPLRT